MILLLQLLLDLLGLYLAVGVLFAIPFAWKGAGRLDPHAIHASWGFRLLILPGATFLWPLLARRWLRGDRTPPTEHTAHRDQANAGPAVSPTQP